MKSEKLLVCGLAVIFSCWLPGLARATDLEEAAKQARESGRPLLIVAGRHTCGLTRAVQAHLQEPALGPALSPYVNVFVDVDGPEGRSCQEKFGHPGNMLPFVYVVRADGEKLYSHSGIMASDEIQEMLVSELAKAGRNLSAKETALLKKAIEEARRAKKSGDLGEAVRAVLPLKKLGPLGNISCFTGPGLEANQLVAQLTDEGKEMLKKVDEECKDGKPTLDAMLTYVKARRAFLLMPTLKADLAAAARKYDHRAAFTEVLAQAEAFERVQAAEAAHNTKRAADGLKRIVANYPDTEAAKRAAEQLKKYSDEGAAAPAAAASAGELKPTYRTWTDTSGKFSIKARSATVEGDKVSLETEEGRTIRIPIEKLSEADRTFLKSLGKP